MKVDESSHHYIVLSFLTAWLEHRAVPIARGRMLDYGSGGQPYRALFEPVVEVYVTADVAAYGALVPDVLIEPNRRLPLQSGSFDTILSSQTLEHVPDPVFYLGECARLLAPGGRLILTAPMQWRHHEVPYDYLRFTRYGLARILEDQGFQVEDMASTGGAFALIGQILLNHLNERKIYRRSVIRLINRVSLWLDRRYPDGDDVINWMCIARRGA